MTKHDTPAAAPGLPRLGMFPKFQRWVLEGRKTTTLRSKRMADGRYVMFMGGKPYAEVTVLSVANPIVWTKVPPQGKQTIARAEGFATVPEFEAALSELKIHGNYWLRPFLAGTKPLYLHVLSNPKRIEVTK